MMGVRKKPLKKHKRLKTKALCNPEVAAIYSSLEPERLLLIRLAELRKHSGETQETIAVKVCTAKSNISRLEKNLHSPTLTTLKKYIEALGYDFELIIRKKSPECCV